MKRIVAIVGLTATLLAFGSILADEPFQPPRSFAQASSETALKEAAASLETVTLSVPNMSCVTCPITVRKALERVPGVVKAEASLEDKTATVTFDESKTDVSALIEATTNVGYPSTVVE